MRLGGPPPLVEAVRGANRQPGPVVTWAGNWLLSSGFGGLDAFFTAHRRDALVQLWVFADGISPAIVQRDRTAALDLTRRVAQHAALASATPTYVLEPEFNKGGVESWSGWNDYFTDAAQIIRDANPGARVAYAPGPFRDVTGEAQRFRPCIAAADVLGVSGALYAATRKPLADGPDRILACLRQMRSGAPVESTGKGAMLTDVAFSTYGGSFAASPPFAGGDGRANEAAQLAALQRLGSLRAALEGQGVSDIVYRSLQDDPGFPVSNYFGWGERFWGVVRADRSHKPAYDALMALADAQGPSVEQLQAEIASLRTILAEIRTLASPP